MNVKRVFMTTRNQRVNRLFLALFLIYIFGEGVGGGG